jgi:serine/threonine protein kinase
MHPHIITVKAVTEMADEFARESETTLMILMQHPDGSLAGRLQECVAMGLGGIPKIELLGYLRDVANGLDYLRAQSIRHGDIRPRNIWLIDGRAMVAGLDLACIVEERRRANLPVLAPEYLAPECLEDPSRVPDDRYSLAVTYCELRTGKIPFSGETTSEITVAKQSGDLDLPAVLAAERAVLRRALAPNPTGRFSSAMEFVEALRATVTGGSDARLDRQLCEVITDPRQLFVLSLVNTGLCRRVEDFVTQYGDDGDFPGVVMWLTSAGFLVKGEKGLSLTGRGLFALGDIGHQEPVK